MLGPTDGDKHPEGEDEHAPKGALHQIVVDGDSRMRSPRVQSDMQRDDGHHQERELGSNLVHGTRLLGLAFDHKSSHRLRPGMTRDGAHEHVLAGRRHEGDLNRGELGPLHEMCRVLCSPLPTVCCFAKGSTRSR